MTNAELIAEARLDHNCALGPCNVRQLADALEASGIEVARLNAHIRACDGICACHTDLTAWPADLLEAIRHMDDAPGVGRDKAHAMLTRYGLIA